MSAITVMDRRGFLGHIFTAGALVLGARVLPGASKADTAAWHPSVYLGLETDGTVIIVAHRSEMGTGIRTVLPTLVADELDADWKRVKLDQAIGDEKYGSQNTDGSCSIRDFYIAMRQAGATARLMLEQAAASKWNVPASECQARLHEVVHSKSGRKASYGELATMAAKLPVPKPEQLRYKSAAEYRYVGKDVPMADLQDIVTGKGAFGYDAKMPGMLIASIERPPVYGGAVAKVDDAEARKVSGVQQTVVLDRFQGAQMFQQLGGVAVLANSTWAAMQARKKLKVDWTASPNATYESGAYRKQLEDKARRPQKVVRNTGNVDEAFAGAARTHEAAYYVPMLSHAPMEPPAAVAEFKDGKVTAWAATQNPQAVQEAVSAALGIQKSDVVCHVTLLGGGFGRKSKPDYVVEAALLSRKVGKPVKVVWTREDDIRFDYFHTVAAMYMKAGMDASGRTTAWLQRSVFPTIGSTFDPSAEYGQEFEMGMGWVDLPFDIAHHRAENGPAKNHVRIGWMRSVANIYHAFAIHSFVDELAHLAGKDPVDYLLATIGPARKIDIRPEGLKYWNNTMPQDKYPVDTARLRRVVELAAEKSGWANKKPSKNRALGIAAHRSFLSYVATVVEIEIDDRGTLHIPRMDFAVDCGTIMHPDRVVSQFEGAGVFGASIARTGEITAADGRIQQSNFHNYPVARMNESPRQTHVHIVPSTDLPAGVGEPGVPPVAPAICNAIFRATGKRIRELPLKRHKLA